MDMSAGGKYKFKRVVDFTKQDAFVCDYFLYDAAGKLVAEVQDVPMISLELPVEKLSFGADKIGDKTVKFDNLKLYANGLAADFEVYDAEAGRKFSAEEMETPYAKNVGYRLSWLNGTAYEKEYSVVAAYYNGNTLVEEKVIETVKMAPGTDHVSTGIVEVSDGLSVKLYARNDSKPEPEAGADDSTNDNQSTDKKTEKNNSGLIIAIVAVVVVLIAMVVVGVIVLNKKPAAKEEKKPEQQEEKQEEQE